VNVKRPSPSRVSFSLPTLGGKNGSLVRLVHWLTAKRKEVYVKTQNPLIVNHNTLMVVFILRHDLDIGQRRPHIIFECNAGSEHAFHHVNGAPISIRELHAPVSLLRLPTCRCQCASSACSIGIKVPHYYWTWHTIPHSDRTLASRPRHPSH